MTMASWQRPSDNQGYPSDSAFPDFVLQDFSEFDFINEGEDGAFYGDTMDHGGNNIPGIGSAPRQQMFQNRIPSYPTTLWGSHTATPPHSVSPGAYTLGFSPDYNGVATITLNLPSTHIPEDPTTNRRQSSISNIDNTRPHAITTSSSKREKKIVNGFSCRIATCKKLFDRACDEKKHYKTTHIPNDEKPHGCEHCDRRFIYPKDVQRHARQTHSVNKVSEDSFEHSDEFDYSPNISDPEIVISEPFKKQDIATDYHSAGNDYEAVTYDVATAGHPHVDDANRSMQDADVTPGGSIYDRTAASTLWTPDTFIPGSADIPRIYTHRPSFTPTASDVFVDDPAYTISPTQFESSDNGLLTSLPRQDQNAGFVPGFEGQTQLKTPSLDSSTTYGAHPGSINNDARQMYDPRFSWMANPSSSNISNLSASLYLDPQLPASPCNKRRSVDHGDIEGLPKRARSVRHGQDRRNAHSFGLQRRNTDTQALLDENKPKRRFSSLKSVVSMFANLQIWHKESMGPKEADKCIYVTQDNVNYRRIPLKREESPEALVRQIGHTFGYHLRSSDDVLLSRCGNGRHIMAAQLMTAIRKGARTGNPLELLFTVKDDTKNAA